MACSARHCVHSSAGRPEIAFVIEWAEQGLMGTRHSLNGSSMLLRIPFSLVPYLFARSRQTKRFLGKLLAGFPAAAKKLFYGLQQLFVIRLSLVSRFPDLQRSPRRETTGSRLVAFMMLCRRVGGK